MKTEAAILASSVIALVAVLAASSTIAAPMEKRLMMALSLQASPTVAEIDLGGLLPTPTVPPIAGEIANIFTSVADGVTGLIPTTIPSPTLPDLLPDLTVSVAIAAPTAPPEAQVLGLLAQKALNAVPTLLIQNLVQIQSEFSAALASIATATPTPLVYVATENGAEVTRTSTPTLPSFAANGVINPLSVLANALPRPTDFVQEVTSVIGGVTSVLQLPALPLPTDLIPLLGTMQLPQLDVPGLLGDKQHLCVKDGNGHQLGLCENGPIINDSEVIAI
ncbi:hypothetical protein PSEUBRA_000588 [Kalmanozyma brasiliensis GHG001]|uniref:Uncharacterized protein n=1 Tax=Kalmanozyma brasiliensis (strain GHG001) TaxID=1365824 RepID=V5EX06_KALBG|nr:uncharacterized protein PSEUBRA_000588 [Kalmanozyma brasiliensis GHG001]EST10175.1 hypothetical protein PSEUBRA_000588 [Kalmanozyma brasiliensis GHG001]